MQINIWLRGTPDFLIPVPTSGETMLLNQTNNTLFEKGFLVLPRSFSYCCAVSTEIEGTAYPSVFDYHVNVHSNLSQDSSPIR